MSNQNSAEVYSVPARLRGLENLHVLFWLIKDICWCIAFRPLGIAMIFPTLSIAVYIMWKNRRNVAELAHNIAIALWIIANSMWMVLEFFGLDDAYKMYCLIPFSMGLTVLVFYYAYYVPVTRRKQVAEALAVNVNE